MTYRDTFVSCPACGAALEGAAARRRCAACAGDWIACAALAEMIATITYGRELAPPELVAASAPAAALACPSCGVAMESGTIGGTAVSRCGAGHGYWIARDGLVDVLRTAALRPAPEPPALDEDPFVAALPPPWAKLLDARAATQPSRLFLSRKARELRELARAVLYLPDEVISIQVVTHVERSQSVHAIEICLREGLVVEIGRGGSDAVLEAYARELRDHLRARQTPLP